MDPVTIAAAASTASNALHSVSTTLYTLTSSVNKIDKSIQRSESWVQTTEWTIRAVGELSTKPLITRVKDGVPEAETIWQVTTETVDDTRPWVTKGKDGRIREAAQAIQAQSEERRNR